MQYLSYQKGNKPGEADKGLRVEKPQPRGALCLPDRVFKGIAAEFGFLKSFAVKYHYTGKTTRREANG